MKKIIFTLVIFIFGLNLSKAAPGDDCSTAILVGANGCSTAGQYNNTGITGTLAPLTCFSTGNNNGMWFKFVATGPVVNATVNGGTLASPMIGLLSNGASGSCTGTFTQLGCSNPGTASASVTYSSLTAGNTYFIYVDGANNNVGTFQLCLTSPSQPSNDSPCNATSIPTSNFCSGPGAYTTLGATGESITATSIPACFDAAGVINSVYFSFTAVGTSAQVTINGTTLVRPQVAIIQASPCTGTGFTATNGSCAQAASGNNVSLTIGNAVIGQTYLIIVDGVGANTGSFEICFNNYNPTSTVINDDCTGATHLCPGNRYYATTAGATPLNDPNVNQWSCNAVVDNSVWFTYMSTSPVQPVSFSINGSCTADALQFEVFRKTTTGSPCATTSGWSSIGCSNSISPSGSATLNIPASSMTANTQYFIVVDNWPGEACDFDFLITGNQGANAGADQTVCINAAPFALTGFSPTTGGTWSGPGITSSAGTFSPAAAGIGTHTLYYSFFGSCTDTKTITVTGPNVNVSNGVSICPGACTTLLGDATQSNTTVTTPSFSNTADFNIPDVSTTGVSSPITVSGLTNATISSVTLNIDHVTDSQLDIFLVCPDGTQLELSTDNGGNGDNYTNTVFNTTASVNITSGAAPFTGTFAPEGGSLSSLNSCTLNGTWNLLVKDDASGTTGIIRDWSIAFTNSVTVTNPATTVSWAPTTAMTGSTTLSPTVCPTSTTTYTLTATDANGCIATDMVTITTSASVISSFVAPAAQCLTGNSYSFTPTSTGVTAGVTTYVWNFGDGSPATTATTSTAAQTHTYATAGTFTVSLTTATGTCSNTFTATIIVNPMPAVPVLNPVNPTCGLNNGSITVTSPTGAGFSYSINNFSTSQTTTAFNSLAAGTYTISVRNGTTCTSTATVTLTAQPFVTSINLTSVTAHCGLADGSVGIGTAVGGTGPYTYSFNVAAGPFSTLTPTVTVGSLAANTYTVFVRDANLCAAQNTITVANAPGPTGPNATPTNSTCGLSNGSVTLAPPTTGTGPFSYAFNNAAATFTTTTSYTGLAAATYTYVVRDNFGCTIPGTVTVNNTAGPTALALSQVPSVCTGNTGQIIIGAVTTTGSTSFTYSFNNTAGPFTATSPITSLAAGNYSVTVRDANGCVFTNTVSVTASSAPTDVALTTTPATCGASNGVINVGAVTGGQSPYTWSLDNAPFGTTASYTGQTATTHTIVVRDNNGCEYTETIGVSSSTGPTALAVTSTPSSCVPNDGTVSIGAVTGGQSPYQYSFNGGALSTTTNYTGIGAGTYPVSVTDFNNCVFATTITVDPSLPPTAIITTPANSTCGNANGTVTYGAVTGGTAAYTYSFNNSAYTTSTSYTTAAGTFNVGVRDAKGCTYTTTVTVANTPGPTDLVLTPSPSTCGASNGQIEVTTTTGGTSTYMYSVDGGAFQSSTTFTGLNASTHTIEVRDANGCLYSEPIAVSDLPGPTAVALNPTNATCGNVNGSFTIGAVTGGTPTMTYSVAPGAGGFTTTTSYTSLAAATYTVTVKDNNGCLLVAQTTVTNVPGPTAVALSSVAANCGAANGSVTVGTVTGGTSAFQYSIDGTTFQAGTTFPNLLPNTYTVTVKDNNNCIITNTVQVNNVGAPSVLLTAQTPVTCFGTATGSATFTASGGAGGFTYVLNTGASNATGVFNSLAAGSYTVTVTDAALCTATQTVTIIQPTALSGSIVSQTDPLCNGGINGSLEVTGLNATPGYTYSLNGGASQASGLFTGLAMGSYTVTVTDSRGCTFPVPVTLSQPTPLATNLSSTNANCTAANGTATVVASGGTSGYTYSWAPSGGANATTTGVISGNYTVTVTDANGCSTTGSTPVGVTMGGVATITNVIPVSCFGGSDGSASVSMSATAATSYTYSWTPSGGTGITANGLATGTYSVEVIDNFGCVANASTTITEPLQLVTNLTSTNVSCNGGSDGTITSTTTGGTSPYTYIWSPSVGNTSNVSSLPIGTYSVIVTDAHSCTVTANVTLSQPTPLSITPVVTNANCNQSDGSFTVTAAGGAGSYSYSLDGGVFINPGSYTNLASGTYSVTVKDGNNCEATFPVTIGDNAGPTASITASTNVSCFGGSDGTATITASGGTNTFTYLWSNGSVTPSATSLAAGLYTVTATDANGCVASTGVTITQPTQLVANASGVDPKCNGGNDGTGLAGALGGTAPYSYSWTTIPAQLTAAASGLIAGPYNVIVTDDKGCQATASITLVNPPSLTASITKVDLSCFNQCAGEATAVIGNAALPIQYNWTGGQLTQTASGLCAGSYTVNVVDGNNCTASAFTTINQPTELVATIPTSGNETCFNTNDAFAQAVATGGTPLYTFTWSNGFVGANNTNLDAGTYVVTVIDNNGCTSQASTTLTSPPPMVMDVTKTDITCNYAPPYPPINDGTAFATTTGGTAPYQYLWHPMLYTVNNPVTLQAGSHTVVVTDDNGCKDSTTIFINEPPEFTIALESDSSNCHFSNGATNVVVTGGATPHTIAWSNGVNTPYNPGLPAGQYDIIVTDAIGCLVNGTVVVEDIEGPDVTITDSTNITCFGANNGSAVAVANGGVLPYMSLGWAGTTQSGLSASNLGPGPATILVYDAAGCLGSDQTFIMEPSDVVGAVVSYQDVTCYNLFNGNAVVQATGGFYPTDLNTDNAYQISIATPLQTQAGVAANSSITFSGLGVGATGSTHVYTVTVTDVRGCQDVTSVTISQPQALVISDPLETDITCFGLTNGQISTSVTGGTPVYTYNWTSSNPSFTNPGTPVLTGLPAGTYTLSVVDINGCPDNALASVIEPPKLILDSIVVTATCGLPNGTATVIGYDGTPIPGVGYTYQWNTSPNQTTQIATGLSENTYNVIVTDANGCMENTNVIVPNAAGPSVANISSYQAKCFGSATGSADVDAIGGTAPLVYTWTSVSGVQLISGPAPNDSVMGIPAGTYNVNITDANGCFTNTVSVVAQPAQVTLVLSSDQTMCYGDSVQIYANVGGGTAPYTWTWFHDGTSIPAYNFTGASLSNGPHWVQPSYLTPLHTYNVSVRDVFGCYPNPVSQNIEVQTLPPITIASSNLSACNLSMVTLSADASGGNTSIGGTINYNWTPGNQTTSSIVVQAQDNPTHEMTYVVTASDGCSRDTSISVVVTIHPKPVASFVGINTQGCEDLNVSFAGSAGTGFTGSTFAWSFGDNATAMGQNTSHVYSASSMAVDSFDVQLIVISDMGCKDTLVQENYVVVYPTPDAQFTFNPMNATEFDPQINFYNQSLLGSTFDWSFGEATSTNNSSVDENPVHTYSAPGLYNVFLEVTSAYGCIDTVSHPVYIEPEFAIYVPNAFSPNIDGRNETFYPQGIGIDETKYNLYIFDRWGELIFESDNFSKGWDGKVKGKSNVVQEDVYIWKIIAYDVKNNKHNLTGHVTVVR